MACLLSKADLHCCIAFILAVLTRFKVSIPWAAASRFTASSGSMYLASLPRGQELCEMVDEEHHEGLTILATTNALKACNDGGEDNTLG
jgi:hypothetical protein